MGWCLCKGVISGLVAGLTLFVIQPSVCQGQAANFVPPPRNIADITSILDQEKPDPAKLAKMTAEAEALPAGCKWKSLVGFLLQTRTGAQFARPHAGRNRGQRASDQKC